MGKKAIIARLAALDLLKLPDSEIASRLSVPIETLKRYRVSKDYSESLSSLISHSVPSLSPHEEAQLLKTRAALYTSLDLALEAINGILSNPDVSPMAKITAARTILAYTMEKSPSKAAESAHSIPQSQEFVDSIRKLVEAIKAPIPTQEVPAYVVESPAEPDFPPLPLPEDIPE